MTGEERQRLMDFIVEQSAKNSVELEKLLNRDSIAARQSSKKAIEKALGRNLILRCSF